MKFRTVLRVFPQLWPFWAWGCSFRRPSFGPSLAAPSAAGDQGAEGLGRIPGAGNADQGRRAKGSARGRRHSDRRRGRQRRHRQRGRDRHDGRPRRRQARPARHLLSSPTARSAKGITLGMSAAADAGLMKITDPGKWPFAAMGDCDALEAGHVVPGHRPSVGLSTGTAAGGPRRPRPAEEREHHPDRLPAGRRRLRRAAAWTSKARSSASTAASPAPPTSICTCRSMSSATMWDQMLKSESLQPVVAGPQRAGRQNAVPPSRAGRESVRGSHQVRRRRRRLGNDRRPRRLDPDQGERI